MLPPRGLTALCTDILLCTHLRGGDARRGGSRGDPAHAWVHRGPSGGWAALLPDPGRCWEAAPALRWGCVGHAALHAWKRTGCDPRRGRALPALPKPTPRTRGAPSRCRHLCDPPSFSIHSTVFLILQSNPARIYGSPGVSAPRWRRCGVGRCLAVSPLPTHVGRGGRADVTAPEELVFIAPAGWKHPGAAGGCRETARPGGSLCLWRWRVRKDPWREPPQILPGAPGTNYRDPVSWEMCWPLPALPG